MEQSSEPRGVPLAALRELVALADEDGHLTDAAASLGIPQSTMSRRIHSLESRLGVPLTVPRGRAIGLTDAARDLVAAVRTPLREIHTALADTAEVADPEHGTIRFGFPLTMGAGEVVVFGHRLDFGSLRFGLGFGRLNVGAGCRGACDGE